MNVALRKILYSPLDGILHLVALLPFRVLYFLSDCLFFLVRYVARYRVKKVKANIAASFPEKSEKERNEIVRKFYHHFCDTFFETIKLLHISDDQMRRHAQFRNVEQVEQYVREGNSVAIYAAHFGNWEWLTSIVLWGKFPENLNISQVYRPLKNKWFDNFYFNLRARFNTLSIPKTNVFRTLLAANKNGGFMTGFISDQKPSHNDGTYHINFLGQDTPFITGTELILRKLNPAVMYFYVTKVARGKYVIEMKPIADEAAACKEYEITDRFAEILESQIRQQPELWLWTHNRWRRPRK